MSEGYFVAGIAPKVGKTLFCTALATQLRKGGAKVGVVKPIDTGCPVSSLPDAISDVGGMPGEMDAEAVAAMSRLQDLAGPPPSYIIGQTPHTSLDARDGLPLQVASGRADIDIEEISPYRFAPELEPAICARYADAPLVMDELTGACNTVALQSDVTVIEGCWSLMSPLDSKNTLLDLVVALEMPVILVVPSQAGVVGPTLLAASALASRGVELRGVVINRLAPDLAFDEAANPFQIETYLGDIVRGVIPHFEDDKLGDFNYLAERLRVHVDLDGFQ